jgi:uncharacterized protein (DUF2384 family)
MKTKSQNERIRTALERGEKLTPIGALKRFNCLRLAARVEQLRRAGMPIRTHKITRNGSTFAQYSL